MGWFRSCNATHTLKIYLWMNNSWCFSKKYFKIIIKMCTLFIWWLHHMSSCGNNMNTFLRIESTYALNKIFQRFFFYLSLRLLFVNDPCGKSICDVVEISWGDIRVFGLKKNLSRKSPLDFHLIAVGETSTILNICDLILWEEFLDFSQHVWTLPCLLPLSYIWLSSDCCRHTPWASGFHFGQMIVIIEIRIGWMSAAPPSAAMALTSRQGLCPSFTCTASLLQRGPSALKCYLQTLILASCLFCVPQKQTRPDFCYMA